MDECAGLDALITNRVWSAMHLDPATTLHDVRWGEHYKGDGIDDFVWVFQISGACRPRTFSADTRKPSASASLPCTSGWAAAR